MNNKEQELRDALEDMVWQFAYRSCGAHERPRLHTGGLSALEGAFSLLGWDDPHYITAKDDVLCDVAGCGQFSTSGGINWKEHGYWRLCSDHAFSKEPMPSMKRAAIKREKSRDEKGCLPCDTL